MENEKETKMITRKEFVEFGVDRDDLRKMEELFPDGMDLTEENIDIALSNRIDLSWMLEGIAFDYVESNSENDFVSENRSIALVDSLNKIYDEFQLKIEQLFNAKMDDKEFDKAVRDIQKERSKREIGVLIDAMRS